MALSEDVSRIAAAAATHRAPGQQVVAVLAVETAAGERVYLAAFADADGRQEWLAFDHDGVPVGLQIVGRPGDEATVLRVASVLASVLPSRCV